MPSHEGASQARPLAERPHVGDPAGAAQLPRRGSGSSLSGSCCGWPALGRRSTGTPSQPAQSGQRDPPDQHLDDHDEHGDAQGRDDLPRRQPTQAPHARPRGDAQRLGHGRTGARHSTSRPRARRSSRNAVTSVVARCSSMPYALDQGRDELRLGHRGGERLPQHTAAAVELEVDGALEVEHDDLVADELPRQVRLPELHHHHPRSSVRARRARHVAHRRLRLPSRGRLAVRHEPDRGGVRVPLRHDRDAAAGDGTRRTSTACTRSKGRARRRCDGPRAASRSRVGGTRRWCSRSPPTSPDATACPSRWRSRGCSPT